MTGTLERILVEPGDEGAGRHAAGHHPRGRRAPRRRPAHRLRPYPPPAAPAPRARAADARRRHRPWRASACASVPSARQLAAELGVDLARVTGSGPDGRIMRRDIEEAARAGAPAPEAAAPAARARPPGADAAGDRGGDDALGARDPALPRDDDDRHEPRHGVARRREQPRPIAGRLLYGVLLIKAVALALRDVPELNAVWSSEGVRVECRRSTSAWRSRCAAAVSSRRRSTTPTSRRSTS